MTLQTSGEHEAVISMERFSHVLKAVECSEHMILSFNSNLSYHHAVNSWGWVNHHDKRTFIFIANAAACGGNSSREPWLVDTIEYDPLHLTVHLNATKKDWKEVAEHYELDFGRFLPATASSLNKRLTLSKEVSLDITHNAPTNFFTSLSFPNSMSFALTCAACGTHGTIYMAGHIRTSWFSIKEFTVSAVPRGVGANMDMRFGISMSVPGMSFSPEPVNFLTVPLGGIYIPGLIKLGPELTLGAGLSITAATGSATIAAVINSSIPDTAVAEFQLHGKRGATFSGWTPQFHHGPLSISESLTASIDVFGRAEVGVALEVLGTGIDLGIVLKIPDVVFSASAVHDSSGVCDDKKYREGVNLGLGVGADLGLSGSAKVLGTMQEFLKVPVFHSGAAFYRASGPCVGFGHLVKDGS
jgi:hypothetical protein